MPHLPPRIKAGRSDEVLKKENLNPLQILSVLFWQIENLQRNSEIQRCCATNKKVNHRVDGKGADSYLKLEICI